jgi:hypothetical protein
MGRKTKDSLLLMIIWNRKMTHHVLKKKEEDPSNPILSCT